MKGFQSSYNFEFLPGNKLKSILIYKKYNYEYKLYNYLYKL